jgi:hypothetical protein
MANIYIINSNNTCGSNKYIVDLIKKYKKHYFINNAITLNNIANRIKDDILLLQNIVGFNIMYDDIINIVRKYKIKLVIPIHDFYFINSMDGKNIKNIHTVPTINNINKELFMVAHKIICPSYFMYDIFIKFVDINIREKMVVEYHNDIISYNENMYIPKIINNINNNINIGIITHINIVKGEDYYLELINQPYNFHIFGKITSNKEKSFVRKNVFIHGRYNEDNIYQLLIKNNIHGLLFLSNTPESYCYALTKGINSRLPILYIDIGAIGERLSVYNNMRFIKYNKLTDFDKFINYIKNNNNIGSPYTI